MVKTLEITATMKDKYGHEIKHNDLCLVTTMKETMRDQELYRYNKNEKCFIPQRRMVIVGRYKLILDEVHEEDLGNKEVRRLYEPETL